MQIQPHNGSLLFHTLTLVYVEEISIRNSLTAVFSNTRPSRIFSQRSNVFLVDVNHLFYDNSLERALNEKHFSSKFSDEWNDEKILREVLTKL